MPIFPRYEPPTIYVHLRFPSNESKRGRRSESQLWICQLVRAQIFPQTERKDGEKNRLEEGKKEEEEKKKQVG